VRLQTALCTTRFSLSCYSNTTLLRYHGSTQMPISMSRLRFRSGIYEVGPGDVRFIVRSMRYDFGCLYPLGWFLEFDVTTFERNEGSSAGRPWMNWMQVKKLRWQQVVVRIHIMSNQANWVSFPHKSNQVTDLVSSQVLLYCKLELSNFAGRCVKSKSSDFKTPNSPLIIFRISRKAEKSINR